MHSVQDLEQDRVARRTEASEARKRWQILVGLAGDWLRETALVAKRDFTEVDVQAARQFWRAAAPYVHPNIRPGFWDHNLLMQIYSQEIAQRVGLDVYELGTLAYIHDFGKTIFTRFGIQENAGLVALRLAGVRKELLEELPPIDRILGQREPKIRSATDLTLDQLVLDLSDTIGKLGPDGKPMTLEAFRMYAAGTHRRYAGAVWPSEEAALKVLAKNIETYGQPSKVNAPEEMKYLREKYGLDFEELRVVVDGMFHYPENQRWLKEVNWSQESLDREIDEKLGRPRISTVVFDIGGVFLNATDEEVTRAVAQKTGWSPERISAALADPEITGKAMAGMITTEEFLKRFYASVGAKLPETYDQQVEPFFYPEIFQPIAGMTEILEALQKKGVQIYFLTDGIPTAVKMGKEIMGRVYGIDSKFIFASCELKATKRGNGEAFDKFLQKIGREDKNGPNWDMLFVDDNRQYSYLARAKANMRGFTFDGVRRLNRELKQAGLI